MLYNKKLRFPLFDAAFTKIATADGKDLKAFEENARKFFVDNDLVDIAINIGGQFLPGLEPATKIVKAICSFASGRKYKNELEKGPNSQLYFAVMSKKEGKEIRNNYIHECFKRDVKAFFAEMEQPYVVFIDGYENYVSLLKNENYADDKDDWLREALVKELPNVLWVIAGREKLNWDEELLPSDQQHRVGDLSQKDTAEFFKKVNIVDEELVGALYKLTNGTPAYLYLCKRTYEKIVEIRKPIIDDFGKNTSELVERYLENMSDSDKKIMIMLSFFPKVWDIHMAENVARALGYEGYIDNIYKLVKMSLFERAENGYKLHETFRSVVKNAHKDRQERIGTAIIQYLTQILLNSRASMDYMHRCMQFVEAFELCEKKVVSDEEMKEVLLNIFEELYIKGEHVFEVLENALERAKYNPNVIISCKSCRCINLQNIGKYAESLDIAKQTLEYANKQTEVDDISWIDSYGNIGKACCLMEENQEALEYLSKAYALAFDKWGEKNLITVNTLRSLAEVYTELEQFEIAKDILEKVYEVYMESLGKKDKDTVMVLSDIARIYIKLGEFEKALNYSRQAYDGIKSALGEEHIITIGILSDMALIYSNLCEYNEAEKLYRKIYPLMINTLEEKHPNVATVLENMASLYSYLDQHYKALDLYNKAYEIYKCISEEIHPSAVRTLYNIAIEYSRIGKIDEAKTLSVQALEFMKSRIGEDKLEIATMQYGLANICTDLGEYEEAKCYYELAYETRKMVLGENNLDTIFTLDKLAKLLSDLEEYEEAKPLFEKVYEVYKLEFGEDSSEAVGILFYLASIASELGDLEEAKCLYEKLYGLMKGSLGEGNSEVFNILNKLAAVYNDLEEYDDAKNLYAEVYDKMKEQLSVEHPYICDALYNISWAYAGLEEYKKAKEIFEELYAIIRTMPEEKDFATNVAELIEELNGIIEK